MRPEPYQHPFFTPVIMLDGSVRDPFFTRREDLRPTSRAPLGFFMDGRLVLAATSYGDGSPSVGIFEWEIRDDEGNIPLDEHGDQPGLYIQTRTAMNEATIAVLKFLLQHGEITLIPAFHAKDTITINLFTRQFGNIRVEADSFERALDMCAHTLADALEKK